MTRSSGYGYKTIEDFAGVTPHQLWRRHRHAAPRALLAPWLPAANGWRLLRTDLFEEALGEGLYPRLLKRGCYFMAVDISAPASGEFSPFLFRENMPKLNYPG